MISASRIGHADRHRHAAFFGFVDAIFPDVGAAGWSVWRDRGGWTDAYEVFALSEGGALVATIGRSRMRLVIEGREQTGYQLGAVATHPAYRGQGLSRRLMRSVIDAPPDAPEHPVLLFANPTVLDFYPRFGFRQVVHRHARAPFPAAPAGRMAPRCDMGDPAQRTRLARLCARAAAIPGRLAARDYGWLALWHLSACPAQADGPVTACWLDDAEALVATSIEDGWLVLHDVFAPRPFDLRAAVPRLIGAPVAGVEFRFDPAAWWPAACEAVPANPEATLFLRGAAALDGPVLFADLAHT